MKCIKKKLLRVVWLLQMLFFGGYYIVGDGGLYATHAQHAENEATLADILHLQKEITHLEREVIAWQTDLFYIEKVAREQLQMAKDGEELYLISRK